MNKYSNNSDTARLFWQCRRGMLELDILLENFLKKNIQNLSQHDLHHFRCLLKNPDNLLLEYLMGRTIPMDKELASVVEKIRQTPCN